MRQVAEAVASAREAQQRWTTFAPAERSRLMHLLADVIRRNLDRYATAEQAGTGKPREDAVAEVASAADVLSFYAAAVRTQTAPAGGRWMPGRESWVRWEPIGVVAAVVPWNYPILVAIWRIAPALAAGNTVVLKPAETTPDTALLLSDDVAEVLGQDVLVTVTGGRSTGQELVSSAVDAIAFTGSQAGGLDVSGRAGLRRISLELGGNGPVVMLPDAPEHAYEAVVDASTYNAGQSCAAPARVIALEADYERTVAGLARAMKRRSAGTSFGPLNNPDQVARYDWIMDASKAGARHISHVATGPEEAGGYWRPGVVLADLPDDDVAIVEEVFAPVLTVQPATDVTHALELANSVPQALAGSVWGRDTSVVLAVANGLDCGEVWINCHLEQTPELPHGGRRHSGHGTDLSVLALAEYQRPKCITAAVDL